MKSTSSTTRITTQINSRELQSATTAPVCRMQFDRMFFEAFYTTKAKGTGLGMAIAKRFIEAHHGTMDIVDDCIDGAEFVMKLPRP
jgi:K+-sensing histidine kinase KdpD